MIFVKKHLPDIILRRLNCDPVIWAGIYWPTKCLSVKWLSTTRRGATVLFRIRDFRRKTWNNRQPKPDKTDSTRNSILRRIYMCDFSVRLNRISSANLLNPDGFKGSFTLWR